MSKGRINERAIARLVKKSPMLHKHMEKQAKQKFLKEKARMVSEFRNHPVTREIAGGASAQNTSGTLPDGYGNLFTFIGFNQGDEPTGAIGIMLETNARFKGMHSIKTRGGKTIVAEFKYSLPQEDQLKNVSRMPWGGRSWLYSIETGISGFGNYMYGIINKSRSGKAIQAKHGIHGGAFRPTAYIRKIISNFKTRLLS